MALPPASSVPGATKLPEYCAVCGAPRRESEGVWITQHPEWVHPACVDWARQAFPYDWKLRYLRSVARRLIRAYRIVVKVGRYVSDTKKQWPHGAHQRIEQIKKGDSAVDEAFRHLRDRLDRRS